MNKDQINFINSLDPLGMNGTISTILFAQDIEKFDYVKTLEFLLNSTIMEKNTIMKEQKKLIKFIKDNGLVVVTVLIFIISPLSCLDRSSTTFAGKSSSLTGICPLILLPS